MPKSLLTHHSSYFRNALSGDWTESEDGIKLDDVEPAVFNVFMNWLYDPQLPVTDAEWAVSSETAVKEEVSMSVGLGVS